LIDNDALIAKLKQIRQLAIAAGDTNDFDDP
jgi:hypothetical protein